MYCILCEQQRTYAVDVCLCGAGGDQTHAHVDDLTGAPSKRTVFHFVLGMKPSSRLYPT